MSYRVSILEDKLPKTRTVTGKKFSVTLASHYRDARDIKPGDKMNNYFGSRGALIMWPEDQPLGPVEEALVILLAHWPESQDTQDAKERLRKLVDEME